MNQKKFIATLGVAVLVLSGITLYFVTMSTVNQSEPVAKQPIMRAPATNQPVATQPPPITPALTTYTSAKWGFEFGYPVGYEVKIDVEKATELDLSVRKAGDKEEAKNNDGVCAHCAFRLQVLPKFIGGSEDGDFKTPEDWVKSQKDMGSSYTQTMLAGKVAYTITEEGTGRKTYLVFVASGVMYDRYDVSVRGNDSNADAILATFKFTK